MNRYSRNWTAWCVLFLSAVPAFAHAQNTKAQQQEQLASVPKSVFSDLLQQVNALGTRMKKAGKEETVFDGQLVDDTGKGKPVRVVHQISGMVRLENDKGKKTLAFDGDLLWGSADRVADRVDEALLNTLVLDTPEGMLYALRTGAAMQLLGRGFGPDDKGIRYDIYELTAPDRTTKDPTLRTRRYYFDSKTGLLVSTRYIDAKGVNVETRFSNWTQVDGAAYPGKIERYENGHPVFSFVATTVAGRLRQDGSNFK